MTETWHLSLALLLLVTSCAPDPRWKKNNEGATKADLQRVFSSIMVAEVECTRGTNVVTIDLLISNVVSSQGIDIFRLEADKDKWVAICPDLEKWTNASAHAQDVAIYSPIAFPNNEGNRIHYYAITFLGEPRTNSAYPIWKPFPVWQIDNVRK
jgi:hypothetical protein